MYHCGAPGLESSDASAKVDPNVLAELPHGSQVVSSKSHGSSFWSKTSRIDVKLVDGTPKKYFLKVISGDVGAKMMHSEYESMKSIHSLLPDFAPKPIAWGTYKTTPDKHFFLCDYKDMREEMPDPNKFSPKLAAIHQNSKSPTGKFGFHINTYSGNLPQTNDWEESWETFFVNNMKLALKLEIEAKGHDPEFDVLIPALFNKVIPRLLHPLESEGRSIKPSLIHGDLWYANSGIDVETGESIIFDACCFYAHNEYEFGQWRPACNKFGAQYLTAYHSVVPKSVPEEDYEGRLDFYKLRFNTQVSALFTKDQALRDQMLGDLRDLVKRYG